MRFSTVMFDLDGTLLDTLDDLNLSMQHTLEKFGLPSCTLEQTRARVGNGIQKLVERSLSEGYTSELYDAVYSEFVAYYGEHANDHTKPYLGIPELLERLRAGGYKLGVVSNKNHAPVCDLVKLHFGDAFDVVMGVQEGIARKPAPDMVNAALRELGFVPKESATSIGRDNPTIGRDNPTNPGAGVILAGSSNYSERVAYVGDSEVDILTAANAGLTCITVTWGFRDFDQLKAAGATTFCNNAEELYCTLSGNLQ